MRPKRILLICLVLTFALSFFGCGLSDQDEVVFKIKVAIMPGGSPCTIGNITITSNAGEHINQNNVNGAGYMTYEFDVPGESADVTVMITPGTYTSLVVGVTANLYVGGAYKDGSYLSETGGSGYFGRVFSFWKT